MAHPVAPAASAAVHKQLACANCHYAFLADEPDEFCPRCGQQNHPVVIGFGHIVEEFLEGIFHFDGKVFRTAGLLLFKPGELTRRYLAGHRVPYVPPLRLYVFLSFVYFLLLSIDVSHQKEELKVKGAQTKGFSIKIGGGGLKVNSNLDASKMKDSLKAGGSPVKYDLPGVVKFGSRPGQVNLERLPAEVTDAQIDSIIVSQKAPNTWWQRLLVRRAVRWHEATVEEIVHQVLRGLSILLFVLMPLAALLLKLAYFRQRRYYISHLIFTVHFQCFLLVQMAVLLGLSWLHTPGIVGNGLQFYWVVYFVLALKRVYAQGWFKTLAKSVLLTFAYLLTMVFSLLLILGLGAVVF